LAVLLGANRFPDLSPWRVRLVKAAACGAILFCTWATLGIEAKPLMWALALLGVGVLVYGLGRLQAAPRSAPSSAVQ
jgi:hypothetical protein